MKKMLALMVPAVLCLSLVACGGGDSSVAGTDSSVAQDSSVTQTSSAVEPSSAQEADYLNYTFEFVLPEGFS